MVENHLVLSNCLKKFILVLASNEEQIWQFRENVALGYIVHRSNCVFYKKSPWNVEHTCILRLLSALSLKGKM